MNDADSPATSESNVRARLLDAATKTAAELVWDTTQPNGQPRRCLDTTRAKALFGFRAKWRLREGVAKTVDWYLRNRTGSSFERLSE